MAIYGERGVGKSSLANIIYDLVVGTGRDTFIPAMVGCDAGINFHTKSREKSSNELSIARGGADREDQKLEDQLSDTPNSQEIRCNFSTKVKNPSIIVIDEFDRVDQIVVDVLIRSKLFRIVATDTTLVITTECAVASIEPADSRNMLL